MTEPIEIDCRDVIRLMMQFCAESGMYRSVAALHEETGVSLDSVASLEDLRRAILEGQWASVLTQLNYVAVPPPRLYDIYSYIVEELAGKGDVETARRVLYDTEILQTMRTEDFQRFANLESRVHAAWTGSPVPHTAQSREVIAASLCRILMVVPSSRLLTLLGDAVRYQQAQGAIRGHVARYDIFTASAVTAEHFVERPCIVTRRPTTQMAARSSPECVAFSPNGRFLLTGSIDGFVEVWDPSSGQLRMDLPYQAQDMFMKHDAAVLSVAIHSDSDVFVAGSHDGAIKTWRIGTGNVTRRYDKAHSQGVTSVRLNDDATAVLSCSYEGSVRVHSLLHTQLLVNIVHKSPMNDIAFACPTTTSSEILSGSSDGYLTLWTEGRQTKSLQVLSVTGDSFPTCAVVCVQIMDSTNGIYLVGVRASFLF